MECRLTLQIDRATTELADALAEVAARTFPLACPPSSTSEDIDAFIAENLSADRFARYLTDPDRTVLAARRDGRILGYAMTVRGVPDDPDVQRAADSHAGAAAFDLNEAGTIRRAGITGRRLVRRRRRLGREPPFVGSGRRRQGSCEQQGDQHGSHAD